MTNKEKFLALVTDDENNTLEYIRYRVKNREKIRRYKQKEWNRIDKETHLNNMKKIITIILISIGLNANSQVTDKVAHFGVGYFSGALSSSIVLTHSNGKNEWFKSVSVGFLSGAILGTAKEVYDFKDYGRFDWNDLGATVIGSTLGSVTIKFSINRYERKHLI